MGKAERSRAASGRAGAGWRSLPRVDVPSGRRLYRMQRLLWAASPGTGGAVDLDEIDRRRQEYVEVLFAWNDRLNTNLSLVGSHFGDDARAELDRLYEDFKRVGRGVETVVRAARASEDTTATADMVAREFEGREVGSLNDNGRRSGCVRRWSPITASRWPTISAQTRSPMPGRTGTWFGTSTIPSATSTGSPRVAPDGTVDGGVPWRFQLSQPLTRCAAGSTWC